jgi:hypothetical protein
MGPSKDRKGATSIRLFQKNLRDMITGIRSHKDKQKDFMNKCLQDIRAEVSRKGFTFHPLRLPLAPTAFTSSLHESFRDEPLDVFFSLKKHHFLHMNTLFSSRRS